jgi:hypothetical protein
MGLPAQELTKWVANALTEVTEDGGLSRLELYHAIEGEGLERLQVIRLDADNQLSAEEISERLWTLAEMDAENRTMELRQRYEVRSYIGTNEDQESLCGFVISPTSRVGMPHGSSSTPPTERGTIAHFMSHDERMHTLMVQYSESTAARLMRENKHQADVIQKQNDNAMKVYELVQNLMDKQTERDIERAKATQSARRLDDFMGLLLTITPLIAAKYLGPKAEALASPSLPAKAARDESVMQFLSTLRSDQFATILSALDTSQQISLVHLAKDFALESEKRDAHKPEVLKNGHSPTQEEKQDPPS